MTEVFVSRAQTTVDPAVRADGRCAECGKPRKVKLGVSKLAGSNREALDRALVDPFCSAACCRAWHGCSLPKTLGGGWDGEEVSEARVAASERRRRYSIPGAKGQAA
jgi:hypothetical protein